MTPRSRSLGTILSLGQINRSSAHLNHLSRHPRFSLPAFFRALRPALWALLALAVLLAGCGDRNRASHVELVMGSPQPVPGTTFELRFDAPMIKGDQAGLPAPNPPLVIQPPLPGTFTWLSTRSGVFTPTQPLALNTRYVLTLRPDLHQADGARSDAALHWMVTTPPFAVIATWPLQRDDNSSAQPECKLAFNADVRAADAAPLLTFRDAAGHTMPADVRQGTGEDLYGTYGFGGSDSLRTWQQDADELLSTNSATATPESPTNELPNLIIVTPRDPLPVGHAWRLALASGLPAADGAFRTRQKTEIEVGDVTPFVVEQVEAHNYINSGPSLRLDFSKPLPDSLTNDFRQWIEVNPLPDDLRARVNGRRLILLGDFHGGVDGTVSLRSGFAAAEPFTLAGSNSFAFRMPHVAPRLYFPALSRDQLAAGNRLFPLLSMNVSHVRVRAKLMDWHTAVHALRGYGSYFASNQERNESDDDNEPYRAIDYNVIPGNTVYNTEYDFGADVAESDEPKRTDLSWDTLLGGRKTGVIFLDARRTSVSDDVPALGAQAIIQLTDLGLVTKQSPTGLDVFAFSHETGRPAAGARAFLFDEENQILSESVTDTNGVARLGATTNAAWAAVRLGDDFHAVPLGWNRSWRYRIERYADGTEQDEDTRRVLLFSDRDLYRPAESVHLEAILRAWGEHGLTIPLNTTGTVQCLDSREKKFFQTNVVFSSLGSWSTLIPLPSAARGSYSATLRLGTNDNECAEYRYEFQVHDFKPSAFEIQLPCKESYTAGEPVQLPLSARYLFGKALSHAQVKWSLDASDSGFQPAKYQAFNFQRAGYEARYGRGRSSIALSGRGTLMGSNFIIAPDLTPNPTAPQPRLVSLLAEVTDVNQQTITRRAEFIRHSSDFYLGLRQGADVLNADTPPTVEVVALGTDGRPWPDTVAAHLTLQRVDWQTVRVQGAGKTIGYRNEQVFTNILGEDISVAPAPPPAESQDQASGNPLTNLPPLPAGEYLIEVSAHDTAGRHVISSLGFQVTDSAQVGRNFRDGVQLDLKPNHDAYAPGDTAEILVEAPFSGTALVTVEREKVLRSFVTKLEGNAPTIQVPLEADDVPNVFVSVTLLRGSADSPHEVKEPEYRLGNCDLSVIDPRSHLDVKIAAANTNCLPGQPVEVTVAVSDSSGSPVTGAEIVLYAVDDGILGLTDYKLPDAHGLFYGARALGVESSISLPNLLPEDPDELKFGNKGYLGGGGGGAERIRDNFLACAFWNATLTTDAAGHAHARLTAPDSLTRYRLLAVAHTAASQFGGGESAFQVSKPLVIEPSLPPIANITDHLIARGVLLNQTTNAGDVIVTLELDDKARAGAPATLSRRLPVAAKGTVAVEFPVEFIDAGTTKWVWRAHFADPALGNFVDAVQSTLEVGHIAPLIGEVLLGRTANSETNLLALANPQLLGGKGQITVEIANTRLSELSGSAKDLLHYPYGCAEQTGSSLLPWILLRDTPGLMPARVLGTNDARAAIRAGVARLFSMQTQSGGLGYWPRSKEPMLWASAYGGLVLAVAQQHGFSVPREDFDSLLNYLRDQLKSPGASGSDLSDSCLALYALTLAGRADAGYQEKLFALRGRLSAEDRALLALAIKENHGPSEMIAELLSPAAATTAVDETRFGCPTRAEAIRLLAWIGYQSENAIVDRLVSDLMREQKQGHWVTTQGNAWALLALTEYARRVETKSQPADGQLQYAGQSVPFHLDEHTNVFTQTLTITNSAGANLLLAAATTNLLYTTVSIEARPPETAQPRQDRGFSLQRSYDRLDDDNQLQGSGNWHVGDRVLVTLRLTVRDAAHYVVIDDALPAILEAINPEFRTQEARAAAPVDGGSWWQSDFREIRKDRCLSFADYIEPGSYTLRYVARVRAAGTVTAPAAKVEEMYHPERCGFTETQTLTSERLP